jgi:phage repressor protein C with HTH and peptisase S24 domain
MRPDAELGPGSTQVDAPPIPRPGPFREERRGDRKSTRESVRERVHEMWRYSGIGSFSRFAQACGVPMERLEEILETDEIDDETAEKISRPFNVEYEWVRHGRGLFQRRGEDTEGLVPFDTPAVADDVSEQAGQSKPAIHHEFVHVRKANAGNSARGGMFLEESPADERYAFRADWLQSIGAVPSRVVLLEVEGDSMSPVLQEGDTVLIDLDRTRFKEGRLFAVGVGDALFVKRLQIITGPKGPRIRVISVNPECHTWECRPEDIRIVGEVVWFGRTLA